MHCADCNTPLPDDARFCHHCGQATGAAIDQRRQNVHGPQTNVEQTSGPVLSGEFRGPVSVQIPDPTDPAALRAAYLGRLMQDSARLPLRGIDVGAADPGRARDRHLSLAQVYVELDTTARVPPDFLEALEQGQPLPRLYAIERRERRAGDGEEQETQPLSALHATVASRRLVLLGDPGSGKSTFVHHLTLCLAGQALHPDAGWAARLPGWPAAERDLLPLPVVLRDFARWLERRPPDPEETRRAPARWLWMFIERWLADAGLGDYRGPLLKALLRGQAIVLLDGLDEIGAEGARQRVRDAVADFAASFRRARVLVTCRTLSYSDPAWQLPADAFPSFELAPLDAAQIDNFIGAWYGELAHLGSVPEADAGRLARRLRGAVRRPDLWRLAPNPLLLTVMALVHTHKGRLPEARALLYEDCVDLLLWRWEAMKLGPAEGAEGGLRQLLLAAGLQEVDLKRALWRIAFDAHRAAPGPGADDETTADVAQADLLQALRALHPGESWDWAQALVDRMQERAGLLVERRPGVYGFPHRTFQEYLAGCYLSAQGDFSTAAARLAAQGPLWREVILLAVGRLVHLAGDTDKPLALTAELCPRRAPEGDAGWRGAWLAGEALLETGLARVRKSAFGRERLDCVRERLVALLQRGALPPVDRAAAGRALSALGDPRPGVGVDDVTGLPDVAWRAVAGGTLMMGSAKGDEGAWEDEYGPDGKPYPVEVAPFWVAAYPVTVAQFRPFVDGDGYTNPDYWTPEGWQQREKEGWIAPRYWNDLQWHLDNHPIVGVSWYESVAYCRWLTHQLRTADAETLQALGISGELVDGIRNTEYVVRLPTEAQWEWTARGPGGLRWPWGNEWEDDRCNSREAGVGRTNAVGAFPGSAARWLEEKGAPVHDLAGNVLEWCATRWQKEYPLPREEEWSEAYLAGTSRRVLRGGSFYDLRLYSRGASRSGDNANPRYDGVGLRLVVASWL